MPRIERLAPLSLDFDHVAARLARIDRQLTDTKRTAATMSKTDRVLARQLISELDAMLRELTPPNPKRGANNSKRK